MPGLSTSTVMSSHSNPTSKLSPTSSVSPFKVLVHALLLLNLHVYYLHPLSLLLAVFLPWTRKDLLKFLKHTLMHWTLLNSVTPRLNGCVNRWVRQLLNSMAKAMRSWGLRVWGLVRWPGQKDRVPGTRASISLFLFILQRLWRSFLHWAARYLGYLLTEPEMLSPRCSSPRPSDRYITWRIHRVNLGKVSLIIWLLFLEEYRKYHSASGCRKWRVLGGRKIQHIRWSTLENDFVRMSGGGVILRTAETKLDSPTLVKSTSIDRRHLEEYVAYWRRIGAMQWVLCCVEVFS